ncbi:hypothetical protein NPN14_24905, partial [Vibrio parahaemolyticus]|nr:hypothetical protein [Vibrio parahaemolyticus]
PFESEERAAAMQQIERIAVEENLEVLGWRDLPVDAEKANVGPTAMSVAPHFAQLFVKGTRDEAGVALDRLAFCLRKRVEHEGSVY